MLTCDKDLADYFEATVKEFPQPKAGEQLDHGGVAAGLEKGGFRHHLLPGHLHRGLGAIADFGGKGHHQRQNRPRRCSKTWWPPADDPEAIIKEKGLVQISDTGALEAIAQEIIDANPKEAADFKAGKTKVLGFFVGQLMKKTKGQANPQLANEIFQKLLG